MIQDVNAIFSGAIGTNGTRSAQPITGTSISTNVLDARAVAPASDLGILGGDLWLVVIVVQAFNTLTSLQIDVVSDASSTLASAPLTHFSKTIALAGLTAGAQVIRAPLSTEDCNRFVGLKYTVNGSNPTLGSVLAFLTPTPQRQQVFAGAFSLDA